MRNIMAEKAINPKTLLRELEAIGVDAEQAKADSVYVTGLAFNFWVRVGENNHYLTFSTYAPLHGVKQEVQALRFVNELNDAWSLLQFAISEERERLYAFYMLSYKGGILCQQLRRTVMHFPNIFADVVAEGRARGIIAQHETQMSGLRVSYH